MRIPRLARSTLARVLILATNVALAGAVVLLAAAVFGPPALAPVVPIARSDRYTLDDATPTAERAAYDHIAEVLERPWPIVIDKRETPPTTPTARDALEIVAITAGARVTSCYIRPRGTRAAPAAQAGPGDVVAGFRVVAIDRVGGSATETWRVSVEREGARDATARRREELLFASGS